MEADVAKLDASGRVRGRRERARMRGLRERGLGIQHVEQSRHRRRAALKEVDDPAQRDERPGEHPEVEAERDEASDGDRPAQHERAPEADDGHHAESRENREAGLHDAVEARERHVLLEVSLVQLREPRDLRAAPAETRARCARRQDSPARASSDR